MTEIETVQEQDEMIHSIEYRNRKQRNAQSQSSLAGACGVLLMLLAGQVSVAQQSASVKPAAAATDSVRPAPAAANSTAHTPVLAVPSPLTYVVSLLASNVQSGLVFDPLFGVLSKPGF